MSKTLTPQGSSSSLNQELKEAYIEKIRKFEQTLSSLALLVIDGSHQISDSLMDHIKQLPHFPASTCKRHVYIFNRDDIDQSEFMRNFFSQEDGSQTYLANDAYKYLLIWYVGGKRGITDIFYYPRNQLQLC